MAGSLRQLDLTGDIGIDVTASGLKELFSTAAEAMFKILAPDSPVLPARSRNISVEAPDPEMLLVRWLSELLYLHATGLWLFSEFEICGLEIDGEPLRLQSIARGEQISAERHDVQIELKAVTYHQLSIVQQADGSWKARIIFDI